MANLPEKFDSKRELDGRLEENIKGNPVCFKSVVECNGCNKKVISLPHGIEGREVKEYTDKRFDALDLLEEFCSGKNSYCEISFGKGGAFPAIWISKGPVTAQFKSESLYDGIDPLAISVAIYKAHQKLEESNEQKD